MPAVSSSWGSATRAEERPLIAQSCHARAAGSDTETEDEESAHETVDARCASVRPVGHRAGPLLQHMTMRLAVAALAVCCTVGSVRLASHSSLGQRTGSWALGGQVQQLFAVVHREDGRNFTMKCPTAFTLDKIIHNNLGKWGPNQGKEGIVYQVSETQDGQFQRSLRLEVNAVSSYKPGQENMNGKVGEIGIVSLEAQGMAELEFSFKDEHGNPVKLSYLPVTFYNADERNPSLTQDFVIPHGNFSQVSRDPIKQMERSIISGADARKSEFPQTAVEVLNEWSVAVKYKDVDKFRVTLGTTGGDFACFAFFTLTDAPSCELVDAVASSSFPALIWILLLALLPVLILVVYALIQNCKRVTPEEARRLHAVRMQSEVEQMARRANELLSAPKVDYEAPELIAIIAKLKAHKNYVRALCGAPWNDWSAPGECQVCKIAVDRKEKGLHCANGGHRICWRCMCNEIDWVRLAEDEQKRLQEEAMRGGYSGGYNKS